MEWIKRIKKKLRPKDEIPIRTHQRIDLDGSVESQLQIKKNGKWVNIPTVRAWDESFYS